MREARLVAFVLPALIAAAGCIPRRDNPLDPAHAPNAQLVVREPADCASYDATVPYPAVATIGHGHCVQLDATASADPQSGTSGLSYRFYLEGDPTPIGSGSSPLAFVDGSLLRPLPLGAVTFRVAVDDSAGNEGSADLPIELTNSRPVARADPPRTFPDWGFPWAFEIPFTVDFHGAATDPDGDPIVEWCWTFTAQPETCGPDPDVLGVSLDSMSGGTVATLTAKDALGAVSDPVRAVVEIGQPNLWTVAYPNSSQPAGIARLDQDRRTAGTAAVQLIPVPTAFFQGNLAMIDAGTSELDLLGQDGNVVNPRGSIPNRPEAMEMDPDSTIRVLSADYSVPGTIGARDVQTFSAASGLLVADAQHPTVAVLSSAFEDAFLPQPAGAGIPHAYLAFDGTRLWYGANEGRRVWIAAVDGTPLGSDMLPAGSALTALARRPGTSDVWAVEGQNSGDPSFGEIALVRYRWAGSLQRQVWPLGGAGDALGLVWGDADHFWTYRSGSGVCRFDADALEAAAPIVPPAAVDSCVGAGQFDIPGGATPSGGSWWQDPQFATLLETAPGGSGFVTDSHDLTQARVGLWNWSVESEPTGASPIVRTRSSAPDGTIYRKPNAASPTVPDWWGGGFWEAASNPNRLVRHAEDGTLIDEIDGLRLPDGDEVALRSIGAMSSDSAGMWVYESIETSAFVPYIARIDLRNRPAPGEAAVTLEKRAGFFLDGLPGSTFEARKVGGPGLGLWCLSVPLFSSQPTVQLLDANGTASAVFTVPASETLSVFASVDEYDGSLFLATISSGPVLHVRRFAVNGTLMTTYPTITLAAGTALKDMKASVDRGSASIFTLTEVPPSGGANQPTMTVTAYDLNLTVKNTLSEAGPPALSIAGQTRDAIWILRGEPGSFGTPERISFFGSAAPPTVDALATGDTMQWFLVP